jgi:hypothetical protein
VLVNLTVVVRVIVLRVVERPWSLLAGTGATRPVEECESPAPAPGSEAGGWPPGPDGAPGGECISSVDPACAGGGADPCSSATCELSVPGMA